MKGYQITYIYNTNLNEPSGFYNIEIPVHQELKRLTVSEYTYYKCTPITLNTPIINVWYVFCL